MNSSSKSLVVFDFTETDDLTETVAAKFQGPKPTDKFKFFEDVVKGTNIQSKEIGNVLCVDVDAIGGDDIYSSAVSTTLDAMENCATKRISTLDVVSQIDSKSPEQHPQSCTDKLEIGSMYSRLEVCSSPGAVSPGKGQLNCAVLESPPHHESVDMDVDADECRPERFASTSSNVAEDDVSFDGPSSDHSFSVWEMDERDAAVGFHPDYILYSDIYCMDCELTFSSSCIKIKGSTAYGNQVTFNFQWEIEDIVDIESKWCARFGMAMVNIRIISKDALHAENLYDASGIMELKFSVGDSNWYEKQEAIKALDVRYKTLWNAVLDTDMENKDVALGQNGVLFPRSYFPNFGESFEDVVYPKGDSDAVSISKRDVDLLQPDTFVNDTIIDFYIKFLKNKLQPEERHMFYFFNSFFFRKLADLDKDPSSALEGRAAFQRVRKWTRKVNLFEKDYIFIPVNFNYHWSLIVICHPGEVAKFQDEDVEKSLKVPCILHMDSIKGSHTGLKGLVQSYLFEEWKEKQKETSEDITAKFLNLRFVSLELPQQQNSFDCGLFLLHYVELFLEEAPANFSPFKITKFSKFLNVDWFPPAEASLKRVHIQRLIYDLLDIHSRDISPANDSDKHCTSNCPKNNNDNKTPAEFLSERCSPSKGYHGNFLGSQDGQGIELTLLPASSRTSQYANDSGLILREFFEPGVAAGPFLDAQYHAFDQTAPFNEFKSDMSRIEEEVEADGHIVYSPLAETAFQPQACALPYSSRDFRVDARWNPGNSLHQAEHDIDSSPETSSSSGNSLEIEVNEEGQVGGDLTSEQDRDQSRSPLTENIESAPCEMLHAADSSHPDQTLDANVYTDVLTTCSNTSPGLTHQECDMQENAAVTHDDVRLIDDDPVSELDEQRAAKKMRFSPPLEVEGLTRSLSKDLIS